MNMHSQNKMFSLPMMDIEKVKICVLHFLSAVLEQGAQDVS